MAKHRIPVSFTILVDVDIYAETYGLDPVDAYQDATDHLAATARVAAARVIHNLAAGAEVVEVTDEERTE